MENKFFIPEIYKLSDHFYLNEFTNSGTAIRLRIKNVPQYMHIQRLKALCINVLEPLRRRFGAIRITSGYRCHALNDAVNGAINSQHIYGEAADIHVSNREVGQKMFNFIKNNCTFDQLLFENIRKDQTCWLHVSYKSDRGQNRKQAHEIEFIEPHPNPTISGENTNKVAQLKTS